MSSQLTDLTDFNEIRFIRVFAQNERMWQKSVVLFRDIGYRDIGYGQCDAANALKRFLIGQFVKFFLLMIQCFKVFVTRF